jgi:hypothetical protein
MNDSLLGSLIGWLVLIGIGLWIFFTRKLD